MSRRDYPIELTINNRVFLKVVIDPHYEEKHAESISDEIILELVQLLNGKIFLPKSIDEDGYQYFTNDGLELNDKRYKLIWLLHDNEIYIGVVNAYRR
ncbi:MAG: hypothetical protein LC102_01090 [Ignavibacteriales bacterium]|nr:hypothetical protein [Oligoflexia bacterium]MCZ2142007.1 hypothetical protein [Ignavibacteriales bacterium]